ncbi:MAG TPA: NAD(P)H-binding protein [Usitatibacter sp.]|nr:NAD(P)H-binding protein [Usitatibacter sp.]
MMKRYLVIGGSGTVGSSLVDQLVHEGRRVRITTHRKAATGERDGRTWVYVDLANGEGIEKAFEAVDRAFIMVPPGFADQHAIASPLIAEAKRRKLEKVVMMSAMGANAGDTPFRRAEIELDKSAVPYNVIRPNWFMQNFNTSWVAGIRDEGKIRLPAGRAKTSFIDARDVAACAARLLTSDDLKGKDFDLTGPEPLDHDAVARILSQESGRTITYEDIDPDILRHGLLAAGLPADYTEFLLAILGLLRQGYNERVTGAVKTLLGREPMRFEQYARDYREAWARAA